MKADDEAIGVVYPTWQQGGAQGDFRLHPKDGVPPLTVFLNMCHSTDPNPGIQLHYHVVWGDGSDDRGFCRFTHVYASAGDYAGTACVWDEIPAHAPGACDTFTISAEPLPVKGCALGLPFGQSTWTVVGKGPPDVGVFSASNVTASCKCPSTGEVITLRTFRASCPRGETGTVRGNMCGCSAPI
jgi:hypothetical protein